MTDKVRILFVAEAVTLAHVARPVVLAQSLDPARYEIHFAQCPRYRNLFGELYFTEHFIESISPQQFMTALELGSVLYDLPTLERYVEEDLRLIEQVRPEVVIGDFRLSLAVSAELAGIPYVTISNACWSPYTEQRYIVPELPLTRFLGPGLGQLVFSLGRPIAFALHCIPMHRLRQRYGLKSLGFNLGEVYTHANVTLYADLPGLYKMKALPQNHHVIGPVIWSPALPLPEWWQHLPCNRPFIYLTLGSSGQTGLLPKVVSALGQLNVTVLVSTAGAEMQGVLPQNVFWAKYLPGEEAVKMASLVICNGGSPTTHQALLHGVPIIGLAGNLDQYLNMATLERVGAGRLLRAGNFTAENFTKTICQIMADPAARAAARSLSKSIDANNSLRNFDRVIEEISRKI